ncbi:8027_t:CDS:2, partial [Gigaspora margarita]
NQACIKFKDSNFTTQTRLDAIVHVYDEVHLGHDGYRNKEIDDQYSIDSSEYTSNILVNNNEIENETFCSLLAIFKVLIPVWKMGKNPSHNRNVVQK